MFPIDITFKKKLSPEFDSVSDEKIVTAFKMLLQNSGAEVVENDRNKISFQKKEFNLKYFSGTKEKRWFGIGKAEFEITEPYSFEGKTAIFTINIGRLLLMNGIVAALFILFYLHNNFLIVFVLACLFNIGIGIGRQYILFSQTFKSLRVF
jgi:hypothetical protein